MQNKYLKNSTHYRKIDIPYALPPMPPIWIKLSPGPIFQHFNHPKKYPPVQGGGLQGGVRQGGVLGGGLGGGCQGGSKNPKNGGGGRPGITSTPKIQKNSGFCL